MADAAAEAHGDLSSSSRRLQDLAKWLVGIFGAIGAVIVAGTQLSSIGSLDPGVRVTVLGRELSRLHIAIAGVTLALAGTALAILRAIRVQTAAHLSLAELAGYPKPRKGLNWRIKRRVRAVAEVLSAAYLNMDASSNSKPTPVDELWRGWQKAYKRAVRLRTELLELHLDDQADTLDAQYRLEPQNEGADKPKIWDGLPTGKELVAKDEDPGGAAVAEPAPNFQFVASIDLPNRRVEGTVTPPHTPAPTGQSRIPLTHAWTDATQAAASEVKRYDDIVSVVLEAASYIQVRFIFQRVARQLVAIASVVAVGLAVFVWAANPSGEPSLTLTEPATSANVVVPAGSRATVRPLVGPACDLTQAIRVRVLARSDEVALVQAQASQDGSCVEGETFTIPGSLVQ